MSGGLICAGCQEPTTLGKPVCDRCLGIGSLNNERERDCVLCFARGLTLKDGLHYNKQGGYAGKCIG